jgi:hypothetical protein
MGTRRPATVVLTLSVTFLPEVAPLPESTVFAFPGAVVVIWSWSLALFAVELRFAADSTGFAAWAAAGTSRAAVRTTVRARRRTAAW